MSSPTETPNTPPTGFDRFMRIGLIGVASFCVVGGLGRAMGIDQFDETSMKFFGVAAAILVLHQFSKIKLPGIELERVLQAARQEAKEEAKETVAPVAKRVDLIEEQSPLPGKKKSAESEGGASGGMSVATATTLKVAVAGKQSEGGWNSDPNLGNFDGSPIANGRELLATIEPAAGPQSAACDVTLSVRSTDPTQPLTGAVTFHLHPTFGSGHVRRKNVVGGTATISFTSWGVFTVGVEADDGATRLELNLKDIKGGTDKFYAS